MCNPVVTLRINNRPYMYIKPLTIFQACLEKKIYVPRFCYHVALKIAGNCRMCLLEEKASLKPIASCAVTIGAGMIVYTQTELVKKAREGVLEYLLANHPLDCPICDQGGECDLQDQTMVFGADRGRFYELKRSTPNKNFGFLIKTFLNRCIHCARCTRFMHDVAGVQNLALLGRGYKTEISNYTENFLVSEISGNIIDLCPVGALTSKPYAYKARAWELVSVYTFDIIEPLGASVELNYRGLEIMRILPHVNYEINDEWISDRTRFYYDVFGLQRLAESYCVRSAQYEQISWSSILKLLKNSLVSQFIFFEGACYKNNYSFSFKNGNFVDLEACFSIKLFGLLYSRSFSFLTKNDFRNDYCANLEARLYLFGKADLVPKRLVIGGVNPRFESPVLNIKFRKFVVEELTEIYLFGFCSNINYDYKHISNDVSSLRYFVSAYTNIMVVMREGYQKYLNLASPVYLIAKSLGDISKKEILPNEQVLEDLSFTEYNIGHSENKVLGDLGSKFKAVMLHHVDSDYWETYKNWNGVMMPISFYLEKFGSYFSESGYFFSTITNIFGYSLRGTKEEWRILLALLEYFKKDVSIVQKKIKNVQQNEFGRADFFNLEKKKNSLFEWKNSKTFSRIKNYYEQTVLDRISPVLSLCARRYTIINDYKFIQDK